MNLTTEQRAALEYAISTIEGNQQDDPMTYPQLLKLLRQLLSQSVPAWQITEERKAALEVAVCEIEHIRIDEDRCPLEFQTHANVLRAMLAESEGKL